MGLLGPLLFFALVVYGAWAWRRTELRVPRFIHVLGLLGILLGAWMAWLDITIGEFTWRRAAFEILVMPWLVYAGFFVYSGPLRRAGVARRASDDDAAP
jgi:hypothetical protein